MDKLKKLKCGKVIENANLVKYTTYKINYKADYVVYPNDIEELIKIQGAINKNKYHLSVSTDLEKEYRWVLFLYFPNKEDYFSDFNHPIMQSSIDSIDDLKKYLSTDLNKNINFDKKLISNQVKIISIEQLN